MRRGLGKDIKRYDIGARLRRSLWSYLKLSFLSLPRRLFLDLAVLPAESMYVGEATPDSFRKFIPHACNSIESVIENLWALDRATIARCACALPTEQQSMISLDYGLDLRVGRWEQAVVTNKMQFVSHARMFVGLTSAAGVESYSLMNMLFVLL